jgi:hypothetical protein
MLADTPSGFLDYALLIFLGAEFLLALRMK